LTFAGGIETERRMKMKGQNTYRKFITAQRNIAMRDGKNGAIYAECGQCGFLAYQLGEPADWKCPECGYCAPLGGGS